MIQSTAYGTCLRKTSFPSKKSARDYAGRSAKRTHVHLKTYHCNTCGGWHLTRWKA